MSAFTDAMGTVQTKATEAKASVAEAIAALLAVDSPSISEGNEIISQLSTLTNLASQLIRIEAEDADTTANA